MNKRTLEEEIEFYGAQKVMENVYVGTEDIDGFMVISKEEKSFISIHVPHYAITAISKLVLR
ncbi:hypothetical protein MKY95_19385 [Paenibacillus sp. FSL P4-0176]|uniref:hypothetical protein n=1 Tax=Paenibacillus sp. FSL P4-0176 TaxID=2921631 RepID=UPI0030CB52C3